MPVSQQANFYSSWTADTAAAYKANQQIQLDGVTLNPGDVIPVDSAVHSDGPALRLLLRAGKICYSEEFGQPDWTMTR